MHHNRSLADQKFNLSNYKKKRCENDGSIALEWLNREIQ